MSVSEPSPPLEYDDQGLPVAGGRLWYYSHGLGRWIKIIHVLPMETRKGRWEMHSNRFSRPRPKHLTSRQMKAHARHHPSKWAPWSDEPPPVPDDHRPVPVVA